MGDSSIMATLKLNSYELFTQSENNKPEFGAGVPSGMPIQIVTNHIRSSETYNNTVDAGTASTNPTQWEKTIVSASITPHFANSRILIEMHSAWSAASGANHWSQAILRQINGGSYVAMEGNSNPSNRPISTGLFSSQVNHTETTLRQYAMDVSYAIVEDLPGTTGLVTYTLAIACYATGQTIYLNRGYTHRDTTDGFDPTATSFVKLTEIAA